MEDFRVRIARVIFVGSSLVLMAAACSFSIGAPQSPTSSKSTPDSSKPSPNANSSPASSPDSSGASITNVRLAKDFTYGDVVNPTSSFYPTDRAFHLVVDLSNPPEGTRVGATWYAVDAGSFKNDKLDSETYTLKTGEERVHVSLTNKENWPKGKYKVQVMLNGRLNRTLEFQVK
jgi:hypothetical protein